MALPAWLNITVQFPVPLVIVMVTGALVPVLVPLPEQAPELVIETASPELALAAVWKLEVLTAVKGGNSITVIVWLAGWADVVWMIGGAAE